MFVFVFVYLSKWLHRQVLGAYVKYCNAPLSFVINARSTATLRSPFCKRVFNTFSIILTFGMLHPCFTAPWVFMVAVCCGCAWMRASDSLGQCSYATCKSAPLSTLWRVTLKCLRGLRMLRRAVIGRRPASRSKRGANVVCRAAASSNIHKDRTLLDLLYSALTSNEAR